MDCCSDHLCNACWSCITKKSSTNFNIACVYNNCHGVIRHVSCNMSNMRKVVSCDFQTPRSGLKNQGRAMISFNNFKMFGNLSLKCLIIKKLLKPLTILEGTQSKTSPNLISNNIKITFPSR